MQVSKKTEQKAEAERKRCKPRSIAVGNHMPAPDRAEVLRKRELRKGRGTYGNIIDRQGAAPLMPEEVA